MAGQLPATVKPNPPQSSPDIVQRLRNFCVWNTRQSHYEPVPLTQEAAAEIERLRALSPSSAGMASAAKSKVSNLIEERLADLRKANDVFRGMDLDRSSDIQRNDREIRWLLDMRSELLFPDPAQSPSWQLISLLR